MSKNESTKHSPFFIIHGRDPVLPIDTLLQPRQRYTGEEFVPAMFEHLHNAYAQVTQNIQQAREHNQSLIANKAVPSDFKPGDLVFYFDPSVQPGDSTKLTLYWKTHFRVVSKLGKENYCIKNMLTGKTKIVHSENLRHRDSNDVWDRTYTTVRPPVQASRMPEEQPTRHQPLRGARLPFGDQQWYSQHVPDVPAFIPEQIPVFADLPSQTIGAEPETQETVPNPQETPLNPQVSPPSPLPPPAAPAGPTVYSPTLPEAGEHGQPAPLQQQSTTSPNSNPSPIADPDTIDSPPGQPRYALRSQGPIPDPEDTPGQSRYALRSQGPIPDSDDTLEGFRYTDRQGYKRRCDTSFERIDDDAHDEDKRPRIQCDVDCLVSAEITAPNASSPSPSNEALPTADKTKTGLSATWHSMVSKVSSFCSKTKRRFSKTQR